ncbi:5-oxoprolinase/urea amidolyase family protein [Pseudoclavibacter chungangensis]|uniref:5-oxoprolinase/urea amidolyase family protein n=1 Tax=Pseudoclavibacter chungangensis TaxID=587635 RepID=A0A7J5BYX9_9MICO|nr:5-oxoprolinase/urea amidolyase family protein [Pseudoclavibacter chungangensis]
MQASFRPAGTAGVLIDCGDLDAALRVFTVLRAARDEGALAVGEIVPAARTVLVVGGEARDPRRLVPKLRRLIEAGAAAAEIGTSATETVIPVAYEGPDLGEVAALTGMSAQQVIERHAASEYTVAFTGFAPGFAYLSGGDPALEVPRRSTPRSRIEAGAVGLAGPFSGVYPRASPGGWQIIGRTDHAMWDTRREQPAALLAGGTVRFRPEREHVSARADRTPERTTPPPPGAGPDAATGTPSLRVIDPGLQSLVEDAGRRGVSGMGVGASGTAVPRALGRANRLVGNRPGAAAVELAHGGFAVEAVATTVLALTGAERRGRVTGPSGTRAAPHETPFRLSTGERLELDAPRRGLRTVLAVRGGVLAPATLGSRSRDTLAGLGPEPLAAGDVIAAGDDAVAAVGAPEPPVPTELPAAGEETTLRVVLGPRDDWFDARALATFTGESWEVTPRSDRVGVRLAGTPLTRAEGYRDRELPSEGMVLGALQVPPDGQPVLFLADRPLTGGYPVIAVVHDDDLETAAQLVPGSRIRFTPSDEAGRPSTTEHPGTDTDTEQEMPS